jgi:hypothetical protein
MTVGEGRGRISILPFDPTAFRHGERDWWPNAERPGEHDPWAAHKVDTRISLIHCEWFAVASW